MSLFTYFTPIRHLKHLKQFKSLAPSILLNKIVTYTCKCCCVISVIQFKVLLNYTIKI